MGLDVQNIHKSFGGKEVLHGISFSAAGGAAFGLLGRNGAGKTTTIRIIMDVFLPDEGTVTVDGMPVSRSGKSFGYLPEERGLYPKKKIREQLVYIGMLRGMSRADAGAAALRWLDRLGLVSRAEEKLTALSKGNQQKVQLCAALIDDPEIVILDELFSGLDPVNAGVLRDVLEELIAAGRIVLFSSHQMNYVEEFCENIAIMNQGEIVLSGNLPRIKRGYDRTKIFVTVDLGDADTVRVGVASAEAVERLRAGGVSEIVSAEPKEGGTLVRIATPEDKNRLLTGLLAAGVCLSRFEVLEPTLEEIFIEKAGDPPAGQSREEENA